MKSECICGKNNERSAARRDAVIENGERVRKRYAPLFVDGEDFVEIGKDFECIDFVSKVMLGNGQLTFMRQRELVDFAVDRIEKNNNDKMIFKLSFRPKMCRRCIPPADF
ncbi:MAG: AAC(3) family N-acetyltransferase [Oscillospiraceae bacterium]|nr:AAC(3) family N-acetyltransferase [Oscillospiraceae bacterium]